MQMIPRTRKLSPAQREALAQEIRDLRLNEPGISKSEIGRRLATKYGVTGSYVREITRTHSTD